MTLKLGALIFSARNTYRIESVLGHGTFGITYTVKVIKGRDKNKTYALKEFFINGISSREESGIVSSCSDTISIDQCKAEFIAEAKNLIALNHPNIVKAYEVFEYNGTVYYTMDYIEGENLNSYLKQKSLTLDEAVKIITKIAYALSYMHESQHMLHLDLKPGNVMRRYSDGQIILIDFGLSRYFTDEDMAEGESPIGLGTKGYAPVEQLEYRNRKANFKATIDVYALGATFYKLLTRETPPPASDLVSDDELLENNLRAKEVSDNLIKIVVEAMCPNVRKRTQTIRAFKNAFDGIKTEANPITNNVSSNETVVRTGEDETIVTSANNSLDTEENALANSAIQDEKSRLVKEYMEAFNVEEKDALLYVNTHGIKVTLRAIAAKKAGNTANTQKTANQKVSSPKTEKSKSNDSENGCVVAAICIIIFFAFLLGMTRGCGNKTASEPSYTNAYSDTVEVEADTIY